MEKSRKQAIDYFPMDFNFLNDRRVKRIIRGTGLRGISTLIYLLSSIYKEKGYYINWDEELALDISEQISGVSRRLAREVIMRAVEVGFFDKELFDRHQVLTSYEIQEQFEKITNKNHGITLPYWINHEKQEEAFKNEKVICFQKRSMTKEETNILDPHKELIYPEKGETLGDVEKRLEKKEKRSIKRKKIQKIKEKDYDKTEKIIIYPFASKEFLELWSTWKEYKKQEHSFIYKSAASEQSALNDLKEKSKENEKTASSIIKQSMANGWKGFFRLNYETAQKKNYRGYELGNRPFVSNRPSNKTVLETSKVDSEKLFSLKTPNSYPVKIASTLV